MLSLRAIFECQHFCPTLAVPLRYFLNTAFVRHGGMMLSGLYLVRPDGTVGYFCFCFFFVIILCPTYLFLLLYMYHALTHACYVKSLVLHCKAVV